MGLVHKFSFDNSFRKIEEKLLVYHGQYLA